MIKFILWMLLITIFGGAFLGSIYGIGALITYFNTGADPAAALNIHPNVPLDWPVNVEWLPDDADTGRELEPFIRENIEAAYIRAWLQQGFSYTKGEPHGLKTYFTGPALAMVEDNINHVAEQDLLLQQVATDHLLQLHFYSADGTIAVFTDRQARVAQHIKDGAGQEVMAEEDLAAYQVVMMVDEGNWKVRHWLRRDLQDFGAERPVDAESTPPADELVRIENGQLMLGAEPYEIRGFNYYPQDNTWTDMWTNYEGDTISNDMALISGMGMNTIRIFVPYEQFGIDEPVDNAPDQVQRLRDILNEAWRHDLRVIVTLYDFKSDYNLLTWPKADRHMEELLTTFNRHPAILAWDIKNEPDLDYEAAGEELVNIWLKHAVDQARIYDPHHLITIGWAHAENADEMAQMVDFVSFHFYAPTSEFIDTVTRLKIKVGAEKPILLGEFGLPTWNSRLFPNGHSEEEQYNYLRELLELKESGPTAGYLAWTLYDFTDVPAQVAGRLPWKRSPQRQMGLIRPDGTQKPAADLFKLPLPDNLLSTPLEEPGGLKPFYQTVLIGLFIIALIGIYTIRRIWLYLVDRFGEEIEVGDDADAQEPASVTEGSIASGRKMLTKLRRLWRARRLIRWRKRRDRRYAKWDRRKARRTQRRHRRKGRRLKLANVVRILIGRPVKVDNSIEAYLHHPSAPSAKSQTELDQLHSQGSETMDNNEFKPLIEIPEGVKELQQKLNDGDMTPLSGESHAQTDEKRLKTKAELIRELLAPSKPKNAEVDDEGLTPEDVVESTSDTSAPAEEALDSAEAETVVSMKVPSEEEVEALKAAIDEEQSADQSDPESKESEAASAGQVQVIRDELKPIKTNITLETVTPDTTEIFDLGQYDFDPSESPVQLVYEGGEGEAKEITLDNLDPDTTDIYYLGKNAVEQVNLVKDPVEPVETNETHGEGEIKTSAAHYENAQALIDGADYSTGNPVIHIDLSAGPADFAGAEPEVSETAEENAPAQPGDGFAIDHLAVPAEENEFSQENQTAWPAVSPDEQPEAKIVEAVQPAENTAEKEEKAPVEPEAADDSAKATDPESTPAPQPSKEPDPIAPDMTPLAESEKVIVEIDELESDDKKNESNETAEKAEKAPAEPDPKELEPEAESAEAAPKEVAQPPSEPEEQGGLSKEDIERFFTWED